LSENDVTGYRLYFLDSHGHVWRALEMECENDAEAVRAAEKQQPGGPMELWSLARVVAKFAKSCEVLRSRVSQGGGLPPALSP
jgi:hypothetical protein